MVDHISLNPHSTSTSYSCQSSVRQKKRYPNDCVFSFRVSPTRLGDPTNNYNNRTQITQNAVKHGIVKHRKKLIVPAYAIISHMMFSPSVAADKIGISTSTLRRRFQEMDSGTHWPVTEGEFEEANRKSPEIKDKTSLSAILHDHNADNGKKIDSVTLAVLCCAFKCNNGH